MRTVMERNELEPEDMVSCIFTCTDDLDAEFPAVAARRLGLTQRAAAVRARDGRARRAAARHPADAALLCRRGDRAAPRLPARGGRAAARPRGGAVSGGARMAAGMSLEFAEKMRRIPVYPQAETYEFGGELVKLASNETPFAPDARGDRGDRARAATRSTAIRTPTRRCCAAALAERFEIAPGQRRGRQRLVRDPARGRGGAARAGRRARLRVAVVLDVPAPGGELAGRAR